MDVTSAATVSYQQDDCIYTPERMPGESFSAYKERRAAAQRLVEQAMQTGPHYSKGGISSRQQLRDSMRKSGTMGKRIRAADALTAAWASRRVTKAPRKDKDGAYTLVGRNPRRVWVAGVSAFRAVRLVAPARFDDVAQVEAAS